jgi:hypothetical protein
MHPTLLKKILNLVSNKNLVNFYYIIFFISLSFIFFAIYLHPHVGDDYYFIQGVLDYPNFIKYYTHWYFNWTGRSLQNLLNFWVFSNNLNLMIYKFFLLPSLLFAFYFYLKKIINIKIKFLSIDFIILFICFWFIYPAIDETIFWTGGSINYVVPLFFSIFYLGLFNETVKKNKKNIFVFIFYSIASFLAGSSHLQNFSGCFVVSSFFMFLYYKKNITKFKSILIFYVLFLVGGLVLISAPGNFERLGGLSFETTGLSIIYKSILFITSSVFYLGDTQSSLIYFLLIILFFFLFLNKGSIKFLINKYNYIWFVAFFLSLICTIPAINAINTRVIFFPIFLLTTFFLNIIFVRYNPNYQLRIKKIIFYFLVMIFFLESFLGSLTNYAYKKENEIRINIIKNAKAKSINQAIVPHYKIIPSRLTYMHTPKQDADFLNNLSKIYQIEIKYDNSFPRSKDIKKDIKFYFDKLIF